MENNMAKNTIMKEIQTADFVLKELNLFLDTHPYHKEALEMFEKYEKKSANLKSEYEKLFGPITPSANDNSNAWEWLQGPWPWEN